jgi:hypothetical protein
MRAKENGMPKGRMKKEDVVYAVIDKIKRDLESEERGSTDCVYNLLCGLRTSALVDYLQMDEQLSRAEDVLWAIEREAMFVNPVIDGWVVTALNDDEEFKAECLWEAVEMCYQKVKESE